MLSPTRTFFIPAGVRHETLCDGTETMRRAYVNPDTFPLEWSDCTPVKVTSLGSEVIDFLANVSITAVQRSNSESLLADLLNPVASTTIEVMPTEERARRVAETLELGPAYGRPLSSWGHLVSASDRTLAHLS